MHAKRADSQSYCVYLSVLHIGGGGGKGTWGKPGDELGVESVTTDVHDPNYDSDTQVGLSMQIPTTTCIVR